MGDHKEDGVSVRYYVGVGGSMVAVDAVAVRFGIRLRYYII